MAIVVLDLETVPRYLPDVEAEIRTSAKGRRGTKDELKIQAQIEAKVQSTLDGLKFTPDGAKIICAGLAVINEMEQDITHYATFSGEDENEIAAGVISYLSLHAVHKLVGYNIDSFDLPILLACIARSPYSLNRPISPHAVVDLCTFGYRKEGFRRKLKGAYNSACRLYHITEPTLDGSSVLSLYENKDWETINKYCLEDVKCTGELYLKITKLISL